MFSFSGKGSISDAQSSMHPFAAESSSSGFEHQPSVESIPAAVSDHRVRGFELIPLSRSHPSSRHPSQVVELRSSVSGSAELVMELRYGTEVVELKSWS